MTDEGERLPRPEYRGRVLDAALHLLDRQVQDVHGEPVQTADDLEIGDVPVGESLEGAERPRILAILNGTALSTRVVGGRPPSSTLERIPWRHVADVGTAIRLTIEADDVDATWRERWVRDHIIRRIPGGRHDPE